MTTYHLAALPVVLLLIATLWPAALFVILAAAVAWLWVSRRRERKAADAATKRIRAAEIKRDEALMFAAEMEAERDIANRLLEQIRAEGARVVRPIRRPLHSVPAQRTPESAEVSDFSWPQTARLIQHDDLTALIEATEEER